MKDCVEQIKENAKKCADRIAIIDGERKISYGELLHLVNKISFRLTLGRQRPRIVFDLQQGVEAYALIVAVMNVGGTYCPLDCNAPIERKEQIINEFVPDIVVLESQGEIRELKLPNAITIDSLVTGNNVDSIEREYDDEDIIYVIYTSGTTGNPKGVRICRKALNRFLEWSIQAYDATENDIWGQYSLLSFDLSIVDIFTCLCSGATLFAMNDIPAKKNRPAGVIEKEKITIWHSIPSAVEFMMSNESAKVYDFSSLRLMSFCGEPLRKRHVEFLFKKNCEMIVFNTYGPTEGTLFCTWQELRSENYHGYCDVTMGIGKAIPGWNLKLEDVEDSTDKEIVIYGDYIGKGYLGSIPDSKFTKLEIAGKTVDAFRTGDLVRETDGTLYFSCRKDRQVKIKGFRIELDEIDYRVNEFLNKASVTVVRKETLYTFVECEEEINEAELREYLKSKMETYKIPNGFYRIKQIPRSPNQKTDYNALIESLP